MIGVHMSRDTEDESQKKIEIISREMSEWEIWRDSISRDVKDLNERLSLLELENQWLKKPRNDSKVEFKIERLGCKTKWIHYLKSHRASRWQLILLLVCIALFLYLGIKELKRANQNLDAEFKPVKKEYIKDYTAGIISEQYEMPYFYFQILVNLGNISTGEVNISEYLVMMLESQNNFHGSATIYYYSTGDDTYYETIEELQVEEALALTYDIGHFENHFWFEFRVKYAPPDPSKRSWRLLIRLLTESLTLNGMVSIENCVLSIKRTPEIFKGYDGTRLTWNGNYVTFYSVSYDELVTKKFDGVTVTGELKVSDRQPVLMSVDAVKLDMGITANYNDTIILILPDLMVEYWKEYVDFGYWEWFTAMGGFLSIASAVFFWLAYYIGEIFGDDLSHVGILGEMSFLYANFENIRWIKEVLKKTMLIPIESEVVLADNQEKTFSVKKL